MRSDDKFPARFTAEERAAYKWLRDCKIEGWVVDLLTKQVTTMYGTFDSLVAFRKYIDELYDHAE